MQATQAVNHYEKIVTATLKCVEEQGWAHVTLESVAKAAKLPLATVQGLASDRSDLLLMIGREIDRLAIESLGEGVDLSMPVKDRLFEILMARLDVLQSIRPGFLPIIENMCREPKDLAISLPHLGRSIVGMLEAAGLSTTGWTGAVHIVGLMAVYVRAVRAWQEDDTPDLSKAMVVLDQHLSQAERVAGWLKL